MSTIERTINIPYRLVYIFAKMLQMSEISDRHRLLHLWLLWTSDCPWLPCLSGGFYTTVTWPGVIFLVVIPCRPVHRDRALESIEIYGVSARYSRSGGVSIRHDGGDHVHFRSDRAAAINSIPASTCRGVRARDAPVM